MVRPGPSPSPSPPRVGRGGAGGRRSPDRPLAERRTRWPVLSPRHGDDENHQRDERDESQADTSRPAPDLSSAELHVACSSLLGLIRSGRHQPKGGYGVGHGRGDEAEVVPEARVREGVHPHVGEDAPDRADEDEEPVEQAGEEARCAVANRPRPS